jgi:hypothetical protein
MRMSETSPRLLLPFIQAAQAQKHVTHNEAVELLDLLVQLTVEGFDAITPPATPQDGQVWALGTAPAGPWAGQGGRLAAWANGGWLFLSPRQGWRAARGTDLRVFDGAAWVAPDLPVLDNIDGVGVNTVHDAVNRLALASGASLFSHEGAGHQLKINKAAPGETASVLFQSDFGGRAEFGLAGSDDFSVKVSADGSVWTTALSVAGATGAVAFGQGVSVSGPLVLDSPLAVASGGTGAATPAGARTALELGTAAQADLTTAPGDATAGRVVRRGDLAIVPDGAVAAPALSFAGQTNTGLYRIATSVVGMAVNGVERARWTTGGLQVTGLITGTAVTQSVADTTAGRLMKMGDFGLGEAGNAGTLLSAAGAADALRGWRIDRVAGVNVTLVGGPAGAMGGTFMTLGYGSTNQHQLYCEVAGPGRVFQRFLSGTTWSPWRMLFTQASAVGTVAQSGGVPSGALMEAGSNANGDFQRLADGTQVCTRVLTANAGAATIWNFPAAFVTPPRVQGAAEATVLSVLCLDAPPAGTSCSLSLRDGSGARRADVVHLTAIGRWF